MIEVTFKILEAPDPNGGLPNLNISAAETGEKRTPGEIAQKCLLFNVVIAAFRAQAMDTGAEYKERIEILGAAKPEGESQP